jgi:hypothetical protein
MSRDELMRMGGWQLINDNAITQNQLVVGGLDRTLGSLSLFWSASNCILLRRDILSQMKLATPRLELSASGHRSARHCR